MDKSYSMVYVVVCLLLCRCIVAPHNFELGRCERQVLSIIRDSQNQGAIITAELVVPKSIPGLSSLLGRIVAGSGVIQGIKIAMSNGEFDFNGKLSFLHELLVLHAKVRIPKLITECDVDKYAEFIYRICNSLGLSCGSNQVEKTLINALREVVANTKRQWPGLWNSSHSSKASREAGMYGRLPRLIIAKVKELQYS